MISCTLGARIRRFRTYPSAPPQLIDYKDFGLNEEEYTHWIAENSETSPYSLITKSEEDEISFHHTQSFATLVKRAVIGARMLSGGNASDVHSIMLVAHRLSTEISRSNDIIRAVEEHQANFLSGSIF